MENSQYLRTPKMGNPYVRVLNIIIVCENWLYVWTQ